MFGIKKLISNLVSPVEYEYYEVEEEAPKPSIPATSKVVQWVEEPKEEVKASEPEVREVVRTPAEEALLLAKAKADAKEKEIRDFQEGELKALREMEADDHRTQQLQHQREEENRLMLEAGRALHQKIVEAEAAKSRFESTLAQVEAQMIANAEARAKAEALTAANAASFTEWLNSIQ